MKYYLMPFGFERVADKEVLVNELGDMLVVPIGTARTLSEHGDIDTDLYKTLVANYFISEQVFPATMAIYSSRLREKKHFIDERAALHIFVLTLQCNQRCTYCQASSRDRDAAACTMSKEVMKRSVELMFSSPAPALTMEFQGGEPSLHPELIRYGIEEAEKLRSQQNREVSYVLCTNCVDMNDELLSLCKEFNVLISSSLDGPEWLHNRNRGKVDSHQKVVAGIEKSRRILGEQNVSVLQTTSTLALDYPIEIVDEYVRLGFHNMFLRALNPYGLAADNEDWSLYTDRFIEFYKKAFEHILELNKQGTFFMEDFASIILQKIFSPYDSGFVDLQSPAGIVNSVLVYNYDGNVYTSDEGRMMAEHGDYTFCLGSVFERYEDIVYGPKVQKMAQIWSAETLAGCSDCAWRPYCGADPVRNYSTQGDMYGIRPTSLLCRKNKAIISYLVSLIIERYDEVMPIFKTWML